MNLTSPSRTPIAQESASTAAATDFVDRFLSGFRDRIDRELGAFLAAKRQAAEGPVAELTGSIEALIRGGGKRLRPALVHFTHLACGGHREPAVLPVALATEMLHAYLLIHDDIMDHAEMRRGEPTAHASFRDRHRALGWPGDAGDFGRSVAILVGDLANAWAVELYSRGRRLAEQDGPFDAEALDRCFTAMCEEVIGGQYLEMRLPFAASKEAPTEQDVLRALHLKSGRYSVERPIELGALLADADPATRSALRRFGAAAGEAFQLQDDILGTFGEVETVGKSVASDLAEGKYTLLIHHSLNQASPAGRERLRQILGNPELGRAEIDEARAIIRDSGGLARVAERIRKRLEEARGALEGLPLEAEGRDFFEGLIHYLRDREQ